MVGVKGRTFGKTEDGRTAHLYYLTNAKGVEARITDYGGILVSLRFQTSMKGSATWPSATMPSMSTLEIISVWR
jgi:galactose mutarotase-like enzyme